jgi:ABC-type hemin transport system substrate-binding protein
MVSAMSQPIHTHGQPVNVMILAKEAGYQVIVQGGGVARAFLKKAGKTNARTEIGQID